jgi:hypothetical protein
MVTINLAGEELRCEELTGEQLEAPMLRFAEAIESGETMRQMAAAMRMLRVVVVEADHRKIDALLDRRDSPVRFADIDKAIGEAMKQMADRPTEKSASSSPGDGETRASSTAGSSSPDIRHLAPVEHSRFAASAAS